MWTVEYTDQFESWWEDLDDDDQDRIVASVELLEGFGPALGRPAVDTLKGSRHPNMKELRPRGRHIRILFAFDPHRTAILLFGGDKSGLWDAWYEEAIPIADQLYDEHLRTIADEGLTHE